VIYSPPELFTGGSLYKGVDVWQLGVVIFYLFGEHFPFASTTKEETIYNIVNKEPQFLTPSWVFATEEAIGMIKLMLSKDPTIRPTISEIKSHAWLRKIFKK
jgi:serine/threonine protein kinase